MVLKIKRDSFVESLKMTLPYVSGKKVIPVLSNAKCTTKDNRIKIEANDGTAGIVRYETLEECDEDGSFLIGVADVLKYVIKLRDEFIRLSIDEQTLTIQHETGHADFALCDATEFSSFNIDESEKTEVVVPTSILVDCINTAKPFVSTETLRPVMTAIYAYIGNGKFGYCATDSHVLITNEYDLPDVNGEEKGFKIMPNIFASLIAKTTSDKCNISFNNTHVQYQLGDTIIQSTMAHGVYPSFRRVIPQSHSVEGIIDNETLAKSVERLAIFCESAYQIKMDFDGIDLSLSVNNLDRVKRSSEKLTMNSCSEHMTIGMNAEGMLTCLKALPMGEVIIQMTDALRPMVFKTAEKPNLTIIAMPIAIAE